MVAPALLVTIAWMKARMPLPLAALMLPELVTSAEPVVV